MKYIKFTLTNIVLIITTLCLQGCFTEVAKEPKNQFVIIASDCLYDSDTVLFKSFTKSTKIKIKIHHLRSDSLYTKLNEQGLSTYFDAVILSSTYPTAFLQKSGFLQKIPPKDLPENLRLKLMSKDKDWFVLGYDPYLILSRDYQTYHTYQYRELTKNFLWVSTLSDKADWNPFFGAIISKMNPKNVYTATDWIRDAKKNYIGQLNQNSSMNAELLLTRHSHFKKMTSIKYSPFISGRMIYPNQSIGGVYCNAYTYGIIHKARNYSNALLFLEYLSLETVNLRLNNYWKTFPSLYNEESIYMYQNIHFSKYPVAFLKNDKLIDELDLIKMGFE